MNEDQRGQILSAMAGLAAGEAENLPKQSIERLFLPLPAHGLALRPETVIVRGGRGAGKSLLFRLLVELPDPTRLRKFLGDERVPDGRWIDAFSQSVSHPDVAVLDHFGRTATGDDLRVFWMGHLLRRLHDAAPEIASPPPALVQAWRESGQQPSVWLPIAKDKLGEIAEALDASERALAARDRLFFATYDHLDRIGQFDVSVRRRYLSALLALWLSLANRYRSLRSKLFLRDDLLNTSELEFADASKLRARSVSIEWEVESLYRVVVRQMVGLSPEVGQWLSAAIPGLNLQDQGEFGWMPARMPEPIQRGFGKWLAGDFMGGGSNKGYTYRWIPNHLQDTQKRIVPRSMLNLLGFAAEDALKNPLPPSDGRLMSPRDLAGALDRTSRARVSEIREEYPLVNRLENLRGQSVMIDRSLVISRVAQRVEGESGGLSVEGEAVFDELVRLGVLKVRPDGRIDVPDIYRAGFGIKRKGGVARPK